MIDEHTKHGDKVIFKYPDNGYAVEQVEAKEILEVGKEYTIDDVIVHNFNTEVFLQEFADVSFNSVMFESLGGDDAETRT